jgi:hypothetical protein
MTKARIQAIATQVSKKIVSSGDQCGKLNSAGSSRGRAAGVPVAKATCCAVANGTDAAFPVTVSSVVGIPSITTLGVCQTMRR